MFSKTTVKVHLQVRRSICLLIKSLKSCNLSTVFANFHQITDA